MRCGKSGIAYIYSKFGVIGFVVDYMHYCL